MLVVANKGKTMSEFESDGTHVDIEFLLNIVRIWRHSEILNIDPIFGIAHAVIHANGNVLCHIGFHAIVLELIIGANGLKMI